MARCLFLPEGKLNELTGKLRVASKNEDAGIIQNLLGQGVTSGNAAIFYAKGRRAARFTAKKIARECRIANPIGLEWLVSGKTTLAALNGGIPNLREMDGAGRFAIFVGTNEFLAQIAEEHGQSPVHVREGNCLIELDTKTGACREFRVAPVEDKILDQP